MMWVTKDNVKMVASHKVNTIDITGTGDAFIGCGNVLEAMKAKAFAALSVTKRHRLRIHAVEEFEWVIQRESLNQ
ncbi:hypothetical protein P4361_20410 [Fictibacillus sp. B-59209]|uniref:hypothetical protein n=1 Tax=Fictibacillus sp. B-59209 TaxID=3024873 RepID=UPI002E1CB220|nr:hypothetical protein [Fictibacillus sp. B-59209]